MQKTLVVKIGSSVLFTSRGKLDEFRVHCIIDQIQELRRRGFFVILVVSGAFASGLFHLRRNIVYQVLGRESHRRYSKLNKQILAGTGQALLISQLLKFFSQKGLTITQILLTKHDLKIGRKQIRQTLHEMGNRRIIPVINENDVVDLNSFGGNDLLAAHVAKLMNANLIILSTSTGSRFGVGGGDTKFDAIRAVKKIGFEAVIQDGKKQNCLTEAVCI